MKKIFENRKNQNLEQLKWKEKNKEYISSLNSFFDTVDNVKDEKLKMEIIYKMLKCEEILTKIIEKEVKN